MGVSVISIANSALVKLGARTIMSLDDGCVEARVLKARFDFARQAVLRSGMWGCAIKRVVLAPVVGAPAFSYSHAFNLPSDFVRVREVVNQDDWRVEGQQILCNDDTIYLKYVWNLEDTLKMDALLCEAIACYLAWDCCYKITQSNNLQQSMFAMFNAILGQAKTTAAQEQPSDVFEDDEWLAARNDLDFRKTRRDR